MELDEFLQLWSINMQIEWTNNKRFQFRPYDGQLGRIFFFENVTCNSRKKNISQQLSIGKQLTSIEVKISSDTSIENIFIIMKTLQINRNLLIQTKNGNSVI